MKTNTRCVYGHKMAKKHTKLKNIDLDKFGVITAGIAFLSYCLYLDIIK